MAKDQGGAVARPEIPDELDDSTWRSASSIDVAREDKLRVAIKFCDEGAELLPTADLAYRAKNAGNGRYELFDTETAITAGQGNRAGAAV